MQFLVHLGGHKFLSEFNNDITSCSTRGLDKISNSFKSIISYYYKDLKQVNT